MMTYWCKCKTIYWWIYITTVYLHVNEQKGEEQAYSGEHGIYNYEVHGNADNEFLMVKQL